MSPFDLSQTLLVGDGLLVPCSGPLVPKIALVNSYYFTSE